MKLKTLLLGSAAALMAVTGAQAADAVVAEPEPVEYVRVCDMYGNGFFYIPGTETCLAFSGYVRSDYSFNDSDDDEDSDQWDIRARFNIDARNETDYGTLRSQIRLQSDFGVTQNDDNERTGDDGFSQDLSDGAVGIDRALISLATGSGTLRLGYSDSWQTTFHGYGLPIEKNDGFYGFEQAIFFDYTYSSNGFEVGAGLQARDDADGGPDTIDFDYYGGAKYSGSWGNIAASYIYEGSEDESAWKVSGTLSLIDNLTVRAFYVGDSDGTTDTVQGAGEYAWGVGARYQIVDTFSVSAVYSEVEEADASTGGVEDFFAIGAQWDPVPGLSIRPEARFNDTDDNQYTVRVYRTF